MTYSTVVSRYVDGILRTQRAKLPPKTGGIWTPFFVPHQ